jgi:hypothetical protein
MVKFFSSRGFLAIYSGCLTVVFAVTVLAGFAKPWQSAEFDQITVHRVNVVEPDGTPRLVISDKANFPGAYLHGKDVPRTDRDSAGMIFLNDEGTENGGLIFGGLKDAQGVEHSYGHLSFDRYDQDQTMQIEQNQDGDQRDSGLSINDPHDYPITAQMIADAERMKAAPHGQARTEAFRQFGAKYPPYIHRAYLGRIEDKSVGLTLRDEKGRERLRMMVKADGTPAVELLDENGRVVNQLAAAPAVRH